MAIEVKMPNLGYTMEKGKILEWLKPVGDHIEKGEPLLRIETDKVVYDVEAPASGIIQRILVREGESVPVGFVVAVINGEPAGAPLEQAAKAVGGETPGRDQVRASPLAKKVARELGIDLAQVRGSGTEGRISREDVLRHAQDTGKPSAEPESPPAPGEPTIVRSIELSGLRGAVAQRMMDSLQSTAQITQVMEADVTEAETFRRHFNKGRNEADHISFTDILIKAAALALRDHPLANATIREGHIHLLKEINIGLAIATERGLVVPVIRGVDGMSLTAIHHRASELIRKAREAKLMYEDMAGGTFTISNMGGLDITVFTPILNPPESAILGVGKTTARPVVVDGEIVARQMTYLSLTFDHRIMDGAPAALFQQAIRRCLENPYLMVG
ncbi:MAG TPA: dihydrolipoamide acetyltransferase family protein [Spirochaetia bacterium]|nr:dihydrolipoamide acetyltransferase family protein [Spirochaetia bacterium]